MKNLTTVFVLLGRQRLHQPEYIDSVHDSRESVEKRKQFLQEELGYDAHDIEVKRFFLHSL